MHAVVNLLVSGTVGDTKTDPTVFPYNTVYFRNICMFHKLVRLLNLTH